MLRVSDLDLIAHWPFRENLKDHSESGLSIQNHGVEIGESGGQKSAQFNGAETFLEVPCNLSIGTGDFSCAGWIHTEETEVVGDIISQFDPETRQGWQISVLTHTGMTSTAQSNYRNLHFGIDNGHLGSWTDCGRPGQAVKISAISTLGGHLYAGTFENGQEEVGHLWRYEGEKRWTDLGNPVGCNSVNAIVEFKGALYCALGRYNCNGSALGDPLNTTPGGQVYRVDADGQWTFCGHPGIEDATPEETPTTGHDTGKADNATALTVYQGRLYATSLYREGAFVYDGGTTWTPIGPDVRLMSFTIYRDRSTPSSTAARFFATKAAPNGLTAAVPKPPPRPTRRSLSRASSMSAPGLRAKSIDMTATRPGPVWAGSGTNVKSWPWDFTTAKSISARSQWPTSGGWTAIGSHS